MYEGPLGFSRLTNLGPLVNKNLSASQELEKDRAHTIVHTAARQHDIPKDDISEEQKDLLIKEIADSIHPPTNPVSTSKNDRFQRCMHNYWADRWAEGMAEGSSSFTINNELDKVELMARGCAGMTKANTAEEETIIPEQFKS